MAYQVRCACGRSHPVTAGDAGSSFQCDCGRTLEVPTLHELRHEAGEESLSPVLRLRSQLLAGHLPGTRQCCRCDRETDGQIHVRVDCERAIVEGGARASDRVAGCLAFGWIGFALAEVIFQRRPIERGQDVVIAAPVRVCDSCAPQLRTADDLRAALRKTPDYADLLDRYPRARITRAN